MYEGATLEELLRWHRDLDARVHAIREAMRIIKDEIVKREAAARVPGDPALTQTIRGN